MTLDRCPLRNKWTPRAKDVLPVKRGGPLAYVIRAFRVANQSCRRPSGVLDSSSSSEELGADAIS
jgi:hypothetical protein